MNPTNEGTTINHDVKNGLRRRPSNGKRVAVAVAWTAGAALMTALVGAFQNAESNYFAPTPLKSELANNNACVGVHQPGIMTMLKRDALVIVGRESSFAQPADVVNCPESVKQDTVENYARQAGNSAEEDARKETEATIMEAGKQARERAIKRGGKMADLSQPKPSSSR